MKAFSWSGAPLGLVLVLLSLMQGCQSGSTGFDSRRYACERDDQCLAGFSCQAGWCQAGTGGQVDPGDGGGGEPGLRLAFPDTAQTAVAGECSAGVVLETRSGSAVQPVTSATTVQLSAEPATAITFFLDASCSTPTTFVTVAEGDSRATFYYRGTVAQDVRIDARARDYAPAALNTLLRGSVPSGVAFVTSAQTLASSSCSSRVELEARDVYGNPTIFPTSRNVQLAGTGLTFFSDPGCTSPLSNLTFNTGAGRVAFHFKVRGENTYRLSATVPGMNPARQDVLVLQAVRANICEMPADARSVTCQVSPPQVDLAKTALFFQTSPGGRSPDSGSLRCMLTARDAITCGRNEVGSDTVYIAWRTLELGSLRVQHFQPECRGGNTIQTPILPVAADKSFVLVSGEQAGKILGEDDLFTAKLTPEGDRVDVQFSVPCGGWKGSLQVVEAEGIRVNRGTGAMGGGQTGASSVGQPSVDLTSSVLLFTHRVSNAGVPSVCDRVLRGSLASSTEVAFSRGVDSSSGCATAVIDEIAWERIDFGALARVQSLNVSMDRRQYEATTRLSTPVDDRRTLMFASGQVLNGQAGGESTYSGDDIIGESLTTFEFRSSTELYHVRDSAEGRARWSGYAVQFEP